MNPGVRHSIAVHPHGRGERLLDLALSLLQRGSSPRAWGTRTSDRLRIFPWRFIPTGVGNAPHLPTPCPTRPVHPHGRGERRIGRGEKLHHVGSSPRAWGTRPKKPVRRQIRRFIPTGVGNAHRWPAPWAAGPVHPHGRGERGTHRGVKRPCYGSSPRAWGTLVLAHDDDGAVRFIPTGVGNAVRVKIIVFLLAVHPHGRGERGLVPLQHQLKGGSSPRAWGTPILLRRKWPV